jgi:hypothetical protein
MSEYDSGEDLFDGICTPPNEEIKQKQPGKRKQPDDEYGDFDDDIVELVEAATSAKRPRLDSSHLTDLANHILEEKFGYKAFRHEQEAAIASILQGDSALAIFPTGAGKSLCYQVMMHHGHQGAWYWTLIHLARFLPSPLSVSTCGMHQDRPGSMALPSSYRL